MWWAIRRRAIDLLQQAALATGPTSTISATDRIPSHLSSLKRQPWSEVNLSDFDIRAPGAASLVSKSVQRVIA